MEAVANVPVNLHISIVDPEILDVLFSGSDILTLGGNHFCPTAKERGWLALTVQRREGDDAKVIAECLGDTRHSPEATPLHRARSLGERGRIPPVGRRIWQESTR